MKIFAQFVLSVNKCQSHSAQSHSALLSCKTLIHMMLWSALLLGLSACLPDTTSTSPVSHESSRAHQDYRAGRYEQAAQRYERLAQTSTGTTRDAHLLDASRAWFNHGESVRGLTTMRKVRGPLPHNDPIIKLLMVTDRLVNGQAPAALRELEQMRNRVDNAHIPAYLELRARALSMVGDAPGLIDTLEERETWLKTSEDVKQNQRLIWLALRELGRKHHALTTPDGASISVAGWLELARLYRDNRNNSSALRQQLNQWRNTYTLHSANALLGNLSDGPSGPSRVTSGTPQTVALLLPVSGRLGTAGSAVRDGFIAAYLEDQVSETKPAVRVYDTATQQVGDIYRQAINDGAQVVVGPLSKKNVEQLLISNSVATTTLALNYATNYPRVPINFYQFSLAPEHEAVAVAQHALSEGITRAIALVPETDLGTRLLGSFSAAFEQGGGRVIDMSRYNPNEKDFGEPITQLLNLNSSKNRHRQISAIVGTALEFEPRRRQDAQFVFLVAGPKQGRLLRPQLNYHYANDLPIYSTAGIYENDAQRNRKDIDGVVFADMPWIVSSAEDIDRNRRLLRDAWPQRARARGRLFAMGMDAYHLIPLLHGQKQPLAEGLAGMTGLLTLESGNRIVRDLQIAQVKNGVASEILAPDQSDNSLSELLE